MIKAAKTTCQQHRTLGYKIVDGKWLCRGADCGLPEEQHETTAETAERKRTEGNLQIDAKQAAGNWKNQTDPGAPNWEEPRQARAVVIDTPEGVQRFALLQAAHRLALEINTGLKFKSSTLSALQRRNLTTKRTKRGALEDLVALLARSDWEPSASIRQALGK